MSALVPGIAEERREISRHNNGLLEESRISQCMKGFELDSMLCSIFCITALLSA